MNNKFNEVKDAMIFLLSNQNQICLNRRQVFFAAPNMNVKYPNLPVKDAVRSYISLKHWNFGKIYIKAYFNGAFKISFRDEQLASQFFDKMINLIKNQDTKIQKSPIF